MSSSSLFAQTLGVMLKWMAIMMMMKFWTSRDVYALILSNMRNTNIVWLISAF